MKRWLLLIAALIAVALVAFGVRHVLEERAQRKREVAYAKTLRSYSEVLRTGMTRKDVEEYLSTRNAPFRHMCCVDRKEFSRGVYDDLVKIGQGRSLVLQREECLCCLRVYRPRTTFRRSECGSLRYVNHYHHISLARRLL
jgi:hypothetical protein